MEQKDIEHLERLLLQDFNKHIKNRRAGYCSRVYRIARANMLNIDLIVVMEKAYFNKFHENI